MVTNRKEHTQKTPGKQAPDVVIPKPMKIGASTPYDFQGSNMTAYGGLLPVVTMLEKLQFQELIEQHVTIKRLTTSMPGFRFVLAMILALYVGFSRLNHLQFLGLRHSREMTIVCSPKATQHHADRVPFCRRARRVSCPRANPSPARLRDPGG